MEHRLFKPSSFEEGKHEVVGDCNGIPMQTRWEVETPLFAKEILKYCPANGSILDYGCGVGRLAKEILTQNPAVTVWGTDASLDMLNEAVKYVNNPKFIAATPPNLTNKFDVIYLVYVLQHVPAIEIREILARIHHHLKDDGIFVYCSSDYRMAIRFDQGGFFDDRFLGINLQEEVSRLFDYKAELFDETTLEANPVLKTMIKGGLPHPAKVYTKKKLNDYLHIGQAQVAQEVQVKPLQNVTRPFSDARKILLLNRLAPGDILVMTNAIRDIALAYPNKYMVDVRSPCPDIFQNNPYITHLTYDENKYQKINHEFSQVTQAESNALFGRIYQGETDLISKFVCYIDDVLAIDMHYPIINFSGEAGSHFSEGHREWLERILQIKIPQTSIAPNIFLSQSEQSWLGPLSIKTGHTGDYWIINAGTKNDYTLKQYPFYQEVVDLLKDKITLVQIGLKPHGHKPLNGVIDMVGKTDNLRELFRLIYFAKGVISCVSLPMHVAAAFRKPCVVIAGAREGTRWELYPNHQFIYVNGCLPCATYDGCWKSKLADCENKVADVPKCMLLIKPEDIARSVMRYIEGGMA
jgi:ADP-heptose:LPS heptosyltransferase/ubiquinone/menaquinone biosynthesis C-methylase UbiE